MYLSYSNWKKKNRCYSNEEYQEIAPRKPIYLLSVIMGYITAHNTNMA